MDPCLRREIVDVRYFADNKTGMIINSQGFTIKQEWQ
jgi:hypothetical protein